MKLPKFLLGAMALAMTTPGLTAADAPSAVDAASGNATPAVHASEVTPLTSPGPDPAAVTNAAGWVAATARDYLTSGLPEPAAKLLREAISQPGLDTATKDALNLDLASAYLAQGKTTEAAAALEAVTAKNSAEYQLRSALLAVRSGDWVQAAGQHALMARDSLSTADRPWYYAVAAMLAEQRGDAPAAQAAWEQARDLAATPLQRNQFVMALWLSRLLLSDPSVITAANAQALQESAAGTTNPSLGAQYATRQALMLYRLNRRDEALAVVNKWLQTLPDSDHANKNTLRLLAAFFARNTNPPGDPARAQAMLRQVLQDRLEPGAAGANELVQSQQIALSMLQDGLQDARDRDSLKTFLAGLRPDHPLLKQILLLQSQLAFSMGQPDEAQKYAQTLLDKFPALEDRHDAERENAWRLLADIAAHRQPAQYFAAADALMGLRKELPAGVERTKLLNQLADLSFLDHDYRRAAESYASLLAEPVPPINRGLLLRRAVDSELNANQLSEAIARLDAYGAQPDVSPLDRWYAEWNILSAMQKLGQEKAAFARLNALLAPAAGKDEPPPALRLRLLWLAARLAVSVPDPSAAERAQKLRQAVEAIPKDGTPEISRELRAELGADALEFSYRAAHDAKKTDEENAFYNQLQENYPGTDAALYATFFKAEALRLEDKTAEAQSLMRSFADQYPDSKYAPLARYREAQYAIPRGKLSNWEEAIGLFNKFANAYPNDPLVYNARLKQAELYRRSLAFADALQVYQNLLDTYPNDPQRPEAEIGRADSLMGIAAASNASDPRPRADALDAYERLVDLPGMPVDKSVEAGFKLGTLYAAGDKQGNNRDLDRAVRAFGKVKQLYLNKDSVAQLAQSTEGSSWMGQCLLALAKIFEEQNKPEDAQRIYEQLIYYNLAYGDIAQERLQKLRSAASSAVPAPPSTAPATPPATARAGSATGS